MNILKTQRLALGLALAMTASGAAIADPEGPPTLATSGLTRNQVVAELLAAQRTHRWDEPSAQWVLRVPAQAVASTRTRAEVRAEFAGYQGAHRFDESLGGWVARRTEPPAVGGLTRNEVTASTILFLETHDWSEATQVWTEHARVPRM